MDPSLFVISVSAVNKVPEQGDNVVTACPFNDCNVPSNSGLVVETVMKAVRMLPLSDFLFSCSQKLEQWEKKIRTTKRGGSNAFFSE